MVTPNIRTIKFKRLKEILKEEQYDDLMNWMRGQTVMEEGMFEWDVIRWMHKDEVID